MDLAVSILLWIAVILAGVIAGLIIAAIGATVYREARGKGAETTAERSRLLRVAAEHNAATAEALARTAEHESQRARFEAIRREVEGGKE